MIAESATISRDDSLVEEFALSVRNPEGASGA